MLKKLALFTGVLLFCCNHANADAIDDEINNLNEIPIEKKLELRKPSNEKINYKANNYTPGMLNDIVKFTGQIKTRNAIDSKKEIPAPERVNVKNKKAVKNFMKKQIDTDVDGPNFFDGKEY